MLAEQVAATQPACPGTCLTKPVHITQPGILLLLVCHLCLLQVRYVGGTWRVGGLLVSLAELPEPRQISWAALQRSLRLFC